MLKAEDRRFFGCCFEGLWQVGLLAKVGGNLVREWWGAGLLLSAGMGCAGAFTCPCTRPRIHASVAYSNYLCLETHQDS